MPRSRMNSRNRTNTQQNGMGSALLPAAAAGGAVALADAGGSTVTKCDGENANSFYCKFVQGFNIFKMVLFIIIVLVLLYFIWSWFKKSKK